MKKFPILILAVLGFQVLNLHSQAPDPVKDKPSAPDTSNAPRDAKDDITIDGDRMTFSRDSNRVIFSGNVKLRSPKLDIDCEELEILLLEKSSGEKAPESSAPPQQSQAKEIDTAWARGMGGSVTIVKRPEKAGEATVVCRCGNAIFDGKTEDMELHVFPEVLSGDTRLQGLDRSTIIHLNKAGTMDADGQAKLIRVPGKTPARPTDANASTGTKTDN